jgi:FtsX-like permease family
VKKDRFDSASFRLKAGLRTFRFWLWLIALVGVIVPRRLRADWRQEWEAELRHRERQLAEWDRLDWRNKLELLRRSLSAFWDALCLQPERWEDELIQDLRSRALGQVQFLVRAAGDPNNLIPSIRRAAQSVEKDLPLVNIKTQAEEMNEKYLGGTRSLTTLLGLFSALALALAGVGLYGTMSYTVGRRTKEIGIRMALGAQSSDIFRMALRETLLLAAIGVLIGLPLAMAASRLIASMLFGVKAADPITIAIAILVMLATAVLAGYLPALRATKVDPMDALRRE